MVDFTGDVPPASDFIFVDPELHRVVLTGFMGAGKSTVGRLLANHTGWDFLDLDTHIETTTGKSAQELFKALGETGFRQLETDLWVAALRRSRTIIAPGGAMIDKPANRSILAETPGTRIVFLDAPFQTLIDRCLQQESEGDATYRPLLHKTEVARARYRARRVLYLNHAHQVVDVADKSPEAVVQSILQTLFAKH